VTYYLAALFTWSIQGLRLFVYRFVIFLPFFCSQTKNSTNFTYKDSFIQTIREHKMLQKNKQLNSYARQKKSYDFTVINCAYDINIVLQSIIEGEVGTLRVNISHNLSTNSTERYPEATPGKCFNNLIA